MKQLLKKAMKGDQQAFIQLIELNRTSIVQTASSILKNKEDMEDAIQDCIVTVYQKLPTLHEPRYFKTWMIRILINICCDIVRGRKRVTDFAPYLEESSIQDSALQSDMKSDVAVVMEELQKNDRLLLSLFYMEDLSVRQISEMMHLSENAVKLRISRSRKKFKRIYLEKEAYCG